MATQSAPDRSSTPFGREEVTAAVLEAASELFAERGPAATSIRQVAAHSKVNHGLVFRHFGTKDKLVGAVLDHLAGRISALVEHEVGGAELEQALMLHTRVVARVILDGYPVGELQSGFPNLDLLLERVRPRFTDDREARLAAANIAGLQLGWYLFRPLLQSAFGLDEVGDDELRAATAAAMAAILDQP